MSKENQDFNYSSIEEARARKQELLDKINSYNDALFQDNPLPYTDEEINLMQEEYALLDDKLSLSKEEKLAKLNKKDKKVTEDGTVVEVESFWDKIPTFQLVWLFLGTILACGIFTLIFGNAIYDASLKGLFASFYRQEYQYYSELPITFFGYWWMTFGCYFIYPLVIFGLCLLIFLLYMKKARNQETIKFAKIMFFIQLGFLVVSFILIYFCYISPKIIQKDWSKEYTLAEKYYTWLSQKGYV